MTKLSTTYKTTQPDRIPKCRGNIGGIGHFLLIVEPYITKLAGPKNYKSIMDGTEQMPAQPVGINPDTKKPFTDREKNDRYKLLQIYLDKIDNYSQVLDNVTSGTSCEAVIEPFIADQDPQGAMNAIEEFLTDNGGVPVKKSIENLLDSYIIPDTNSLLADFQTAMQLIVRSHGLLARHGHNLDDSSQASYLRQLLVRLKRFEPIFTAGQCTAKSFTKLCGQIRNAIISNNQNKADQKTIDSKLDHSINEVDIIEANPAAVHWNTDYNSRSSNSSNAGSSQGSTTGSSYSSYNRPPTPRGRSRSPS